MSALGQKRACAAQNGMSALHLKADICCARWAVTLSHNEAFQSIGIKVGRNGAFEAQGLF